MEFWLTFNNLKEKLQLPIPPQQFTIQEGQNINVVNINSIGEAALIGKRKLVTVEISSFFPNTKYSFCQYTGFPKPYECVKMIRSWKESDKPIRLIITETDINLACAIEAFSYGERDASGDVYFTLSLKQYIFRSKSDGNTALGQSIAMYLPKDRQSEKETPATYAVKDDDTLPMIAKKVYGDSGKYTVLMEKNGILDVNDIYSGMVLVT